MTDLPNQIFGYNDYDYKTLFGFPLIAGVFLTAIWLLTFFFFVFLKFNILVLFIFVPIVGIPTIILLFDQFALITYKSVVPTLKNYTPAFITNYLLSLNKTIYSEILKTNEEKMVVMKLHSSSFFDKTTEEQTSIKIGFNELLIYTSNYVPKLILRVVNKKLNMKQYFDTMYYQNRHLFANTVYDVYFKNFEKQYINIAGTIKDYDYYIELRFPVATADTKIREATQILYSEVLSRTRNLGEERRPEILSGERLYQYLKELLLEPSIEEETELPIITDR